MGFPKRALPQGSPGRSPKATRPRAMETDENVSPKHFVAARAASPQRKKVLGERNSGDGGREAVSPAAPQPKPVPSPPSLTGRGAGTYDPKTNYTTPRPDFLRYNPERSREILLRLEREVEVESSSATSGTAASEAVSSGSSARGSDSECDDGDAEEVVVPVHRGGWARRLFLLLVGVAVACSFFYIYCMTSTPLPASSEERLNLFGPNGSMYDAGVQQVDYLLGPNSIDMMGSEDVLEEAIGQIVHGDSENVVYLYGPGGSPRNLMAIPMMGMADVCPNVPLGEFTCQVGDESSDNVDDQKEGCDLGEQKTDMEEKSGLAHQEEGEGYSLQVSLEEVLEPGSEELLHIWACLSVAGFVAAMSKYFQRSRKVPAPVSQHTPSAPPAQMPVLTPHQVAQLPVFPSPQSVQLPMFPSQQSVQLTVPKQEPSVSLELPVHLPLPKPDPFVNFKVPVIDHGNRDQRIRQGDADNMRASDSNTMDRKEIDSFKPPVVELLGEFLFVDAGSSRGRSIKDLNRHGGESRVCFRRAAAGLFSPPPPDFAACRPDPDSARLALASPPPHCLLQRPPPPPLPRRRLASPRPQRRHRAPARLVGRSARAPCTSRPAGFPSSAPPLLLKSRAAAAPEEPRRKPEARTSPASPPARRHPRARLRAAFWLPPPNSPDVAASGVAASVPPSGRRLRGRRLRAAFRLPPPNSGEP